MPASVLFVCREDSFFGPASTLTRLRVPLAAGVESQLGLPALGKLRIQVGANGGEVLNPASRHNLDGSTAAEVRSCIWDADPVVSPFGKRKKGMQGFVDTKNIADPGQYLV